VRPRLRPLLSDVYKDVSYVLDEDGYNEAEYRDEVRKRFVKLWEGLIIGYKVSCAGGVYRREDYTLTLVSSSDSRFLDVIRRA
jgi:hypothetical protein